MRILSVIFAVSLAACGDKSTGPVPPVDIAEPTDPATEGGVLNEPLADDPLGVTIHRLDNGLTVYISPDHSEPRVSAWIAFRSGSRHDPADSTGLAHYLEHMLFKGSAALGTSDIEAETVHLDRIAELYDRLRAAPAAKRKSILTEIDRENAASAAYSIPNELDQLYAELGIDGVNAFTGEDMTVYIADVPSNRFEAWARVEADRFMDPRFRLFYPELETVYEEKNRSLDDPASQIYHAMMRGLFPRHPYGTQPTIGLVEHLKTPAYADMVGYYQRWYVPGNAAIVLAGDITPERALPILEKHFSPWKARPVAEPAEAPLPPLDGRVVKTVRAPGENAVHLAWQTVPAGHPDEAALEVMDLLVDNASTGLLNLDLVLTQKLPKAGSSPDFLVEAGYWRLWGTAREGQSHRQVEALLMGIVQKLRAGTFSQDDIDAIVTNAEIQAKLELESRGARVGKMAFAFLQRRPWPEVVARLDRLRAVKKADVVRVANQYLDSGMVVVERHQGTPEIPKIDKPVITPFSVRAGRRSAFAREVAAMPAPEVEPVFLREGRDYHRPGGTEEIIATVNRRNDLFELSYVIDAGYHRWPLACLALQVAEASGAGSMEAETFKRKLYSLGTSLSFECGRDRISMTLAGLDRHMESSIELLGSLLSSPGFDQARLRKVVSNELSQRRDRMAEPRFLAGAIADYASFGSTSRALSAPSNRELEAATPQAIRDQLRTILSSKKTRLYFGPRPAPEAGRRTRLGKSSAVPPRAPLQFPEHHAGTIFVTPTTVAQSNIAIVYPVSEPLDKGDQALARLYSEYTGGGMGALIFQEIREARGLAYSATGYFQLPRLKGDPVAIVGRLGTQADKTIDALREMNALLPVPPVRQERFRLAVDSLLRRMRTSRVDPRDVPEQVLQFRDRGYRSDPDAHHWKALSQVSLPDFQAFVKRFARLPRAVAMVTDPRRVPAERLGKLGKVITLSPADLVSYDD